VKINIDYGMRTVSVPVRKVAKLESNIRNAPLGSETIQGEPSQKFLVRITSIRKRLLDEDNLCEKYHVDLCRYAGVLPTDSPSQVKIEVCQKKAGKKDVEETIIEVFKI
jgi:hypothetical protein